MFIDLFRRLFARYVQQNMVTTHPGFPLRDGTGRVIGYLETISYEAEHLRLTGWIAATEVALVPVEGTRVSVRPAILREDLPQGLGTPSYGFDFRAIVPGASCMMVTTLKTGPDIFYQLPAAPSARQRKRTVLRMLPDFTWRVVTTLPDGARWFLRKDEIARSRIKTRLGLNTLPAVRSLDSRLFEAAAQPVTDTAITIILPVYNAFDLLPEALNRVERHTDLPWRLILIEDRSTDERVRPFLRDWAAPRPMVELLENEANIGFIGSVNRAFRRAAEIGDPVVLLNSDAFVPAGWAGRLLRPILQDARVATVTPMSNDAEIFSAPTICTRTMLRPGEADRIDDVARGFAALADVDAPTGVGFCMAVNPVFLKKVTEFDTVFGRGYGEEVDWCQKTRAAGGRHVGLAGLFVEHRGGESFGSAAKLEMVRKNNAVITSRYPSYDLEVQKFIQDDPLLTPRLALAIASVAARAGDAPVPIHVAHSLGGGADMYLQRRVEEEAETGAIILRTGGAQRWRLEVQTRSSAIAGQTDDIALIRRLLDPISRRRLIYGCAVGDHDPAGLPDLLLSLLHSPEDEVEVLFHDFFPISPSYCLLDSKGAYRGPVVAGRTDDAAHQTTRQDGTEVSLDAWQAAWGRLIARADRVVAFSENSADLVREAYPQASGNIVVQPHALLSVPPRFAGRVPDKGSIGILGNIGRQKGAAVLADLAKRPDIGPLIVIGDVDPTFPLPSTVRVHGRYRHEDISRLIEEYGISIWLVPSIWPETFSFTIREALATDLPVFCFDLGAQGEATAAAPNGHVIPFNPDGDLAEAVADAVNAWRQDANTHG